MAASIVFIEGLPPACMVHILNYLDPPELESASLVSKQFHACCWHEGIENKIIRVYEIVCRQYDCHGYSNHLFYESRLMERLRHKQLYESEKFSHYRRLKVSFSLPFPPESRHTLQAPIPYQGEELSPFTGVTSLDISLPRFDAENNVGSWLDVGYRVGYMNMLSDNQIIPFLRLFPNIQEIDLSNIGSFGSGAASYFDTLFQYNPLLEKITWNRSYRLSPDGREFKHLKNLKQLIMDEAIFQPRYFPFGVEYAHPGSGVLFENCKSIERLSIRKARMYQGSSEDEIRDLHDSTFYYFVLNAPSTLRWFRSDYPSREDFVQYRLEERYPNIKFLT